jgi:hypothetical protein
MNKFLLVVLLIIGGIAVFSTIRAIFKYFTIFDFVVLTFCAIIVYFTILFWKYVKSRSLA